MSTKKTIKSYRFIALLLFFIVNMATVFPARTDQNNPLLDKLFAQLQLELSSIEAYRLNGQIWQIWHDSNNPLVNRLMETGMQRIQTSNLAGALVTFSQMIEVAPDYAEAWNKRATVHFLLGNDPQSLEDIASTLSLEPRHFGAFAGRGMIMMRQYEYISADKAFSNALKLNPYLKQVKQFRETIKRLHARGEVI